MQTNMNGELFIVRLGRMYADAFRTSSLTRGMMLLVAVKLFIMFFILRLFFFPNYLNTPAVGGDKEEYVGRELIHRAIGDPPGEAIAPLTPE